MFWRCRMNSQNKKGCVYKGHCLWNKLLEKVNTTYWNQPGSLLYWSQLNTSLKMLCCDVSFWPSWCEIFIYDSFRNMFLTTTTRKLPFASRLWLLLPQQFTTSFNIYIFLWHQNAADITKEGWIWSRALALFFKRKQLLILKISEVLSLGLSPWNLRHLPALSCNCQNAKCWGSVSFYSFGIPALPSPLLSIVFFKWIYCIHYSNWWQWSTLISCLFYWWNYYLFRL